MQKSGQIYHFANRGLLALICLFFLFFACSSPNPRPKVLYPVPGEEEINAVIEAVILQDSLGVLRDTSLTGKISLRLSVDLIKIKVKPERLYKQGDAPAPNLEFSHVVYWEKLLSCIYGENQHFFKPADTSYFEFQNDTMLAFKINEALAAKCYTTNAEKVKENTGDGNYAYPPFTEISIPVFSLDHRNAFVMVNSYCGALCGWGTVYYLKDWEGKWKIVMKIPTWIS